MTQQPLELEQEQEQQETEKAQQRLVFAFVFPLASGHINPSFPVARSLVALGHEVHYLCREQMREAVEGTGATFHSEVDVATELYDGREPGMHGAMESLQKEFGLEGESLVHAMMKLKHVDLELQMPGLIRWMRQLRPRAVTYCPMMNHGAPLAAKVLGIPSVALLTTAGPGSIPRAYSEFLAAFQVTVEDMCEVAETFEPNLQAIDRINARYGFDLQPSDGCRPMGVLPVLKHSVATLVTTCEDLQDPMPDDVAESYRRSAVRFEAVGPLLDAAGAKRAAGHKVKCDGVERVETDGADIVAAVREAKASGRRVVLVSMGTVITGDSPHFGWEGRTNSEDGTSRGLSGKELCQSAWAGAFDAFGAEMAQDGPLIVVSLGPQADALEGMRVPANAVCLPVLPQVDILKVGVDVFLTHGGQNSFTEGLAAAVPLVVCPGFADQPVNARKAVALGVGLQVERPDPDEGGEATAMARYRVEVAGALSRVVSEAHFAGAASECARRLASAGGVPRAVELMLFAAAEFDADRHRSPEACGKLAEANSRSRTATSMTACGGA